MQNYNIGESLEFRLPVLCNILVPNRLIFDLSRKRNMISYF